MWFGLARLALKTGSHIYQNRQKTKAAMSDAALMHAERMARGEESYQGKLLESGGHVALPNFLPVQGLSFLIPLVAF